MFRAWDDSNSNGVWDAGEADLTATVSHIQWQLDGSNAAAAGSSSPAVLSGRAISGATTHSYTVPVNSVSSSGAIPGSGVQSEGDFQVRPWPRLASGVLPSGQKYPAAMVTDNDAATVTDGVTA